MEGQEEYGWTTWKEGLPKDCQLGMKSITLAADRIRADKDAQGVCRGFSAAVFAAVLTVARLLSVSGGV